jgi:hypothetical protein
VGVSGTTDVALLRTPPINAMRMPSSTESAVVSTSSRGRKIVYQPTM